MITDKKYRLFFISAAVILVSLLYFFIDARASHIFPRCPFHTITGLYCPGCGSQRALSALLHLDIVSALRYNLLMVAALPMMAYSAWAAVANSFRPGRVSQKLFYAVWFIRLVGIIVILFWILRNLETHPFRLLAPGG